MEPSLQSIVPETSYIMGTFNVRGLKSIYGYLIEKLKNIDFCAIQEHWLLSRDSDLFNSVSHEHKVFFKSATVIDSSRPFVSSRGKGGVALLLRESLVTECSLVPCPLLRIIAVRFKFRNTDDQFILVI